MTADIRKKAVGFLAAAALSIALAPAQGAYMPSHTASAAGGINAMGVTATGAPMEAGYTVAMPVSGQTLGKPGKLRHVRSKDKDS